jgi:hypothetical protein
LSEEIVTVEKSELVLPAQTEPKMAKLPVILASISLVGVLALSGVFSSMYQTIKNENAALSSQLAALGNKVKELEPKVTKIDSVESTANRLKTLTAITFLTHDMESGVVTDDFVVVKVNFFDFDKNLKLMVDLDTQPDIRLKYKGKGVFDLSDRELRAKATDIINKVKEYYNKNKTDGMLGWDDKNAEVALTIKNYEIGKLSGGQFTLAGEK